MCLSISDESSLSGKPPSDDEFACSLPEQITVENPEWLHELEVCAKAKEAKTMKCKKLFKLL